MLWLQVTAKSANQTGLLHFSPNHRISAVVGHISQDIRHNISLAENLFWWRLIFSSIKDVFALNKNLFNCLEGFNQFSDVSECFDLDLAMLNKNISGKFPFFISAHYKQEVHES